MLMVQPFQEDHPLPLPPPPLLCRLLLQLLQRLSLSNAAHGNQGSKLGFAGPGFLMLPVVNGDSGHFTLDALVEIGCINEKWEVVILSHTPQAHSTAALSLLRLGDSQDTMKK